MTLQSRPWLPTSALADEKIPELISREAAQWSRRWFVDPKSITTRGARIVSPIRIAANLHCWSAADGSLMLAADDACLVRIGTHLLALSQTPRLNPADQNLFRRLARDCLLDLLRQLSTFFATHATEFVAPPVRQVSNAVKYTLSCAAGGPTIDVFAADALITAARRHHVHGARTPAALGDVDEAIGRQPIRVGVHLGVGVMGVRDLQSLTPGDVLVLDRDCQQDLPLTINGETREAVSCALLASGTAHTLRITHIGQSSS